ncbi:P-loop domain protein, KAP family [Teladorsagia circumcincta]|uniref:P-loop domain protein, KAP family n=1 Tax=Teladorsagia circumcincta TaxID=45464 RepID=A0A2G9UH42_TELCI|nr:P-loop domain protein, KAP family [Teladorsagia circumcincta]
MDIVYLILERKPNLELKNKDGETPLLRAVKSRHVALCELLVKAGAKISAADNNAGQHGALRKHCGVPIVLLVGVAVFMLLCAEVFMTLWLFSERDASSGALFVAAVAFAVVFLMLTIYPIIMIVRYGYTNVPRRRVNAAARAVHKLRFEGLMQKLQTEERMVQTLDALELLFSARKHRPFITIIAVDPHIIVSAINHNMHSALTGTELTGHDYLKNIVNMPLYLHNSALRQLQNKLKVYHQLKDHIPKKDSLIELDRNPDNFEVIWCLPGRSVVVVLNSDDQLLNSRLFWTRQQFLVRSSLQLVM